MGLERTSSKTFKFIGLYSFFFSVFCSAIPSIQVLGWFSFQAWHHIFEISSLYFAHSLSLTLNIVSNLSSTDTFTMVSHMCLFLTSYVYLHLIPTNVIWIYSLASFAFTIFCFTLLVIKNPLFSDKILNVLSYREVSYFHQAQLIILSLVPLNDNFIYFLHNRRHSKCCLILNNC